MAMTYQQAVDHYISKGMSETDAKAKASAAYAKHPEAFTDKPPAAKPAPKAKAPEAKAAPKKDESVAGNNHRSSMPRLSFDKYQRMMAAVPSPGDDFAGQPPHAGETGTNLREGRLDRADRAGRQGPVADASAVADRKGQPVLTQGDIVYPSRPIPPEVAAAVRSRQPLSEDMIRHLKTGEPLSARRALAGDVAPPPSPASPPPSVRAALGPTSAEPTTDIKRAQVIDRLVKSGRTDLVREVTTAAPDVVNELWAARD